MINNILSSIGLVSSPAVGNASASNGVPFNNGGVSKGVPFSGLPANANAGGNSSSTINAIPGEVILNEFGQAGLSFNDLINSNAQALTQEAADGLLVPDAEITEQSLEALAAGLVNQNETKQQDASSILDTNNAQSLIANATVAQIDNILSNNPSIAAIENNNALTKIVTEDAVIDLAANQNISKLAEPNIQSLDELSKVVASQAQQVADSQADLTTVENPEKISAHLVNKNFAGKQDDRIFGQDNLENMAFYTKQDYLNKANDIISGKNPFGLPDNSGMFTDNETKAFSKEGSIENKNFLFGNNTDNVFGRHADNIAKNSLNQKDSGFRDMVSESAYKIAHIAKNNGGLELQLDPANLGKVHIRFDFAADGKTNVAVVAEKQETLDLLKKDFSSIEKILQDNGLKADSSSLSFNLRGENGSGGYNPSQNDWGNNGSPFAFSLEQDMSNIVVANDTITPTSSASLYNGNLAQGMLSILV